MVLILNQTVEDMHLLINKTVENLVNIPYFSPGFQAMSPIFSIKTTGSKPPLFCVHQMAGDVMGYFYLARRLSPEQPIYGLQAPGLDGQQEPYTKIPDLAAHHIEALSVFQQSGPYFLGGQSFGGFVAFEMARQLQQQGHEVALLAIMDTSALILGRISKVLNNAEMLVMRAKAIEYFFGKKLSVSYEELQQQEPEEQLNYFVEKLKKVNVTIPDLEPQIIRRKLQLMKAHHQALMSYVPQVYLGKITFFRASDLVNDFGVSSQDFLDRTLGWGELTTEPIEIHEVPGNHVTIMNEPHVRILANKLTSCLNDSVAKPCKNQLSVAGSTDPDCLLKFD
ncbi:thioesterase domain-containing protein [Nostoc sp. ChiQUE01b]|uniref:thioesterase domain-containing protein n=1 Tax=Nostoc sp. ChiQUE01b TaxID=3075376 RepID=UPI002AD43366|nr:thioesterase domain-containing protein [Nostoc sp. ChiQUE01b]MDZ8262759.1 thioesterase domain-containing protein [Nostoc sp. ChiQUE01b]